MNSAERREARYQRRKAARMKKKAAALREYGDFETVFSFERLYESYRASVRGVGWKASTQRYKAASLANVTKTHEELIAGRYRSKGFYEFDIVERGKPRHIRSVHISERVVQRCLCDYCLVPMLSRSFIYDNGASLRGKGYDFAVSRVTNFLAEHYRKHGREGYVLVFDFSKYFDTRNALALVCLCLALLRIASFFSIRLLGLLFIYTTLADIAAGLGIISASLVRVELPPALHASNNMLFHGMSNSLLFFRSADL